MAPSLEEARGGARPRGSPEFHQSVSALLAIRSSRAPPSPAGLCVPESKMALSRQRGPQAGARSFFCALLLSFSQFVGSDGTGGDAAAPGAAGTQAELPHRRFEYKYSFKGPHLVQSDGTVPFWAHTGSKPGLGRGAGSSLPSVSSVYLLNALQCRGSAPALHATCTGAGLPRQPQLQVPLAGRFPACPRAFLRSLSTHFQSSLL